MAAQVELALLAPCAGRGRAQHPQIERRAVAEVKVCGRTGGVISPNRGGPGQGEAGAIIDNKADASGHS